MKMQESETRKEKLASWSQELEQYPAESAVAE
jgi:hypothetical protein